jgi:3-hydroxyisobutyrate dehydrogenase
LSVSGETVGFIGLGNMGGALASNLAQTGYRLIAFDSAGPRTAPEGSINAFGVSEVAQQAEVIVLSLPDGVASEAVCRQIATAEDRRATLVIDTSTIGGVAVGIVSKLLTRAGLGFVDAPVSGGVAGARARTLMVMYSGTNEAVLRAEPVLAALSDRRRRVGNRPGMAQAMKLANNFLSATALAAASEAIAYGLSTGLDMSTMLEVLETSSGQSAATTDKFRNHVQTGRFASGFSNSLMAKDVRLYLQDAEERGSAAAIGHVTAALWEQFATEAPGADFTRIYPFVAESGEHRG